MKFLNYIQNIHFIKILILVFVDLYLSLCPSVSCTFVFSDENVMSMSRNHQFFISYIIQFTNCFVRILCYYMPLEYYKLLYSKYTYFLVRINGNQRHNLNNQFKNSKFKVKLFKHLKQLFEIVIVIVLGKQKALQQPLKMSCQKLCQKHHPPL